MTIHAELDRTATVVVIALEQATHKSGHDIVPIVAREQQRCETSVTAETVGALTELVSKGFAEFDLPCSRDNTLACFVRPLDRCYRLTPRGHTWKLHHLRQISGQRHTLRGH